MTDLQQAPTEYEYLKLEEDTHHESASDVSNHDEATNNRNAPSMPLFASFKNHSLIIGLLVGFFVQFSTLGANFLVIALWENDLMTRSKTEIILLSLVWSAFTSFMAILTLGFLRSVITIVFEASLPPSHRHHDQNALLEEVILHLECRFVVGALVGVCLAWTVTDILLGMNIQILFSVVTLAISLLWCKLMMYCFTKEDDQIMMDGENSIATKVAAEDDEHTILLV
ncbi:expressed unknown protein [Seminavis robusta]|uniref:Uncharacterized protein n=1 Tax=Seminavis robusta TaxID=568900 RepID=A0A9N8ED13_9STRA|nr:expressed unknown protein [Seminavis robusta]|eukprot:Sro817_g206790.1 n/a (227) ;mRNA; r:12246-12926